MTKIRRAEIFECEILTDIAVQSEAYWGYDSIFMENFKALYKVTEEFVINNPTYVIEQDKGIIGFYSIQRDEKETALEYFYIEPQSIGKGYGKILWYHMVNNCKDRGIKKIVLVTSPQAKEFYSKMGAILIGEVESLVTKGRKVPKLLYTIQK